MMDVFDGARRKIVDYENLIAALEVSIGQM
jgi:hypothetical protein